MRAASTALVCGLALAACGSSGNSSANASKANAAVLFAQCMRSHGVSGFPDPNAQGGGIAVSPSEVHSPAFQSAQHACQHLLPNKGAPPHMTASQRAAAVRFAECMRTHGAPSFPDPTEHASGNGSVLMLDGMTFAPGPGFDPGSPGFRQAATRCGIKLPTGAHTRPLGP
jgi:hypothetical protein